MAEYLKMAVTPNVEYCLEILQKAVQDLPEGTSKRRAQDALQYLVSTSKGESQPLGGDNCSPPIKIIPLD